MKKVMASLIAVGLLVGFTIWWHGYVYDVVKTTDTFIGEAVSALENGEAVRGMKSLRSAREKWAEAEAVLSLFLSHSITDDIDLSIERAQSYLEHGESNQAITELHTASHSLRALEQSQDISFKNIV